MSGGQSAPPTRRIATARLPEALLDPQAYPHPVGQIQLVETHMSWLFLTGEFVYKVKKPVHFDFVDFSSLERRHFYCREELRLNAGFAPGLYLAVVPIISTGHGRAQIATDVDVDGGGAVDVLEWAVKMCQFDTAQEADVLIDEGRADAEQFREFGGLLASQHAVLPAVTRGVSIQGAIMGNFSTLAGLKRSSPWRQRLDALAQHTRQALKNSSTALDRRITEGFVRECHGDLHLSNMVAINGRMVAFDALEFSRELREIDVWNDAAFLIMDCLVRRRADFAYAFIDGYLDAGADYDGLALLPVYLSYRSMVRAKVAALSLEQATDDEQQRHASARIELHLAWAEAQASRLPGMLLITCGVSGSGKSYWARQLVVALGAVRLRSDVLRKQREGLQPDARTQSALGGGLYGAELTAVLYKDLGERAVELLRSGENVIVDATCLKQSQRLQLLAVAEVAGAKSLVLHMVASEQELRRRIRARSAVGTDASEADEQVLDWQLGSQEPPAAGEPVLEVDTATIALNDLIASVLTRLDLII